ncbi:hypothetical protein KR009_003240 [Drosophila setifemur]|nr:hypothetical protein KR009_003240 [Drosophila setifemur]
MHLTSTLIGLLIVCLGIGGAPPAVAQFWSQALPTPSWESETLANRPSGICYKDKFVETINPNSRRRQISYCCDGYSNEGTPRNLKCLPICKEDCTNGLCITPGYCECAPGYDRRNGRCQQQ